MRKFFLWSLCGIILAVAVLAGASLAVLRGWQREWLREQVESQLTTNLGLPVSIESIEGVLYRGIRVGGVRVGDADSPLARVQSLRLEWGTISLGEPPVVSIDSLAIEGLHVSVRRAEDGAWPWEQAEETESPVEEERWPVRVEIGSVTLDDGSLEAVRTQGDVRWIAFEGRAAELSLDGDTHVGQVRVSAAGRNGEREEPWVTAVAEGSYTASAWRLSELRLDGPIIQGRAEGSGDTVAIADSRVSVSIPSISALALAATFEEPSYAGALEASAELSGPYRWPVGALSASVRGLVSDDLQLGDIELRANSVSEGKLHIEALKLAGGLLQGTTETQADLLISGGRARLEDLRLRSPDGSGILRITASVPSDGDGPEISRHPDTKVTITSADWPLAALQPLWSQLGFELVGALDARLEFVGTPEGPAASGTARLARGRVAVEGGRAQGVDFSLEVAGPVSAPELSAEGNASRVIVNEQEIGALRLSARLGANRKLEIERLELAGPVPLRVESGARVHFGDDDVGFERFVIRGDGQRIAVSGRASATRAEQLRIELASIDTGKTLELVRRLGLVPEGPQIAGELTGHLMWTGTRTNPDLSGRISWPNAQLGDFRFDTIDARVATEDASVHVTSSWVGEGVKLLQLGAALPRSSVLAAPETMPQDPATTARAELEGFELGALSPFVPPAVLHLGGSVTASVDVRGSPTGALFTGQAGLDGGSVELSALSPQRLEPIRARLTFVDQHLVVEQLQIGEPGEGVENPVWLRVEEGAEIHFEDDGVAFEKFVIRGDGQRLVLSGRVSATHAEQLRVELAPVDTGKTLQLVRRFGLVPEGPEISGNLEGHLVWTGPRANPDLSGQIVWSGAQLAEFQFDGIDTRVATEGASVQLTSLWEREGVKFLELSATLPRASVLEKPETILQDRATTAQAQLERFELGALSPFLPPAVSYLGGSATASVDVRGSPTGAHITGQAALDDASVGFSALSRQRLEPIRARVAFEDQHVVLEELLIGKPGENVKGRGEASLDTGSESMDLALDFSAFALNAPGLVRGTLTGPLRLAGNRGDLELTGALEIGELRITIPESDAPELKEIRVVTSDSELAEGGIEEQPDEGSVLDPLRVDLGIKVARNSWARGRGAEVELRGDLQAKKQRNQPLLLSGSIDTVRGTYEIYGRRFRIERGEALLDGSADVDPLLNVRAMHRVRDVRIFAVIEGRLSEPRLRFESQPEMSETDVASYLLLGRPANSAGSEQQPALDAVALQVATGVALSQAEQLLGGALPVDLIDLRMESDGDTSEVKAGVGKYVGERLFLYYERGFGDEPEDELRAEYELTPIWSLESTITGEGETAGDVVFELEY